MTRCDEVGLYRYEVSESRLEIGMPHESQVKMILTQLGVFLVFGGAAFYFGSPTFAVLLGLFCVVSIVAVVSSSRDPLVFDRASQRLTKGKKVIGHLGTVHSVRVERDRSYESPTFVIALECGRPRPMVVRGFSLSKQEADTLAREIAAFLQVPLAAPED